MKAAPSIKHNVAANYAAQIYVIVLRIVMVPVYLSYMGQEAYGLIGFYTVMWSWFQLLDVGLTPTLTRETARFRGGAISAQTLRAFLRTLEVIFFGVSLIGALAVVLFAHGIATDWLNVKNLPTDEVTYAVALMGLSFPVRWLAALYRGLVNGFERQVWLGVYTIVITTVSLVGVLVVLTIMGATPVHFFAYQLLASVVDFACMAAITYRLIPPDKTPKAKFSLKPLMGNLTFSLAIAFAAIVWVAVTQTDKLVLSNILPLAEYGLFSIAVLGANGINAVSSPFAGAFLPRLTRVFAEGDNAGSTRLYGDATQVVCALIVPVAALLIFFAEPILFAWTGKHDIARAAAPILCLYAMGNSCIAIAAFAYYIQYAKGDLKLHFIGQVIYLLSFLPSVIVAATRYGSIGTATVWAVANGLYLLLWVPLVHRRVLPGQHWKWVIRDILPIALPTLSVGWLMSTIVALPADRWWTLGVLAAEGLLLFGIAAGCSSFIRQKLRVPILFQNLVVRKGKI